MSLELYLLILKAQTRFLPVSEKYDVRSPFKKFQKTVISSKCLTVTCLALAGGSSASLIRQFHMCINWIESLIKSKEGENEALYNHVSELAVQLLLCLKTVEHRSLLFLLKVKWEKKIQVI